MHSHACLHTWGLSFVTLICWQVWSKQGLLLVLVSYILSWSPSLLYLLLTDGILS